MKLKICTISPQGNGVRGGGITRFSGALHRKGVENHFWELTKQSWNGTYFGWEGEPFSLENSEDERALIEKLEQYDVVVNNWPTMTTNEQHAIKLWRVWKELKHPVKVTVLHNTILAAVRKENLSPLVWSSSDYLLIQVSEQSTIRKELVKSMPWLEPKIRQFRQVLDISEFEDRIQQSLEISEKDALALWVGRWENCRNTARWGKVLKSANEANYKSPFLHCGMGLESDVKTYWGYFANDKGNHYRLNTFEISNEASFLVNGKIDREKLAEIYKPDKLNDFLIFGKYEYSAGMELLKNAAWGISIFGAWKDDVIEDYLSLAKLEYASLEIMLLSLPVFDYRHLDSMEERTLFDAPWVLKSKHNGTDEENLVLLKRMEEIAKDPVLYREYRLANIDYVKKHHAAENFVQLLESLHSEGKAQNNKNEEQVLEHLYGRKTDLTADMWVSMQHTAKKIPHYIEWESQGEKKPLKMKIVPRRKTEELF